jgi:squalene cyclase
MLWANNGGWAEFDRWWANATALPLADGDWLITAPFVPGGWGSVYGKANNYDAASTAGWTKALVHVSNFALTFGGGCFAGHGVYATAPAQFVLDAYGVQ